MNTKSTLFDGNNDVDTLNSIRLAHSVRVARFNFLGPIALVCVLGGIARFLQAYLLN